jgi:hypothetical protein
LFDVEMRLNWRQARAVHRSMVDTPRVPPVAAALALLCGAGCASLCGSSYDLSVGCWSDEARARFSDRYDCPGSQIEVVPRPDLKLATRSSDPPPTSPLPAPPEIGSDPATIAAWNVNQARVMRFYDERRERQKALAKRPQRSTQPKIYTASGCGIGKFYYYCRHYGGGTGHYGCEQISVDDLQP